MVKEKERECEHGRGVGRQGNRGGPDTRDSWSGESGKAEKDMEKQRQEAEDRIEIDTKEEKKEGGEKEGRLHTCLVPPHPHTHMPRPPPHTD